MRTWTMNCQPANSPQRNAGTLNEERLRLFFELMPEWKSSTLPGSALIDGAPTRDGIKKAAEMFAIYGALLQ